MRVFAMIFSYRVFPLTRYHNISVLKFSRFLKNTLCIKNNYCSDFHSNNLDLFNLNKNEYKTSSELNISDLSNLISVPEDDEKLSIIANEIKDINERRRCPEFLNPEQIRTLYSIETKTQRKEYLNFLSRKEKIKLADKRKKVEKRLKKDNLNSGKTFDCKVDSPSNNGLGKNTLLLRVRKKSMNQFYNCRLANSVLFGSKIVIDLDYEDYMIDKEKCSCASQLRHIVSANRIDSKPFDLYFCNAKPNYNSLKYFKRDAPNLSSLITLYEGSYLDIFPKEHLVYLSPHADESLKLYDPSAIYIIGGFVDKVKKNKVSYDKASAEGIKSYSLPLDEYIQWKQGTKSLTINQVFEIMLVLKNTGNWKKAFECLPPRKIINLAPNVSEIQLLQNNLLLQENLCS